MSRRTGPGATVAGNGFLTVGLELPFQLLFNRREFFVRQ
jgi:hypothetical protein